MVAQTPEYRALDVGNWTDMTTATLQYELAGRGIEADIVPLAGEARLPRIELAFRTLEYGNQNPSEYGDSMKHSRIVVDCALVSGEDKILFVGRIVGTGPFHDVDPAAKAVGEAIAEELSGK